MPKCEQGYEEYRAARGEIHSIPKDDLLPIDSTDLQHECDEFGVHPEIPLLADLYNESQAIFFANAGIIAKPTTKYDNWKKESSVFRPFSHNTMQSAFHKLDIYDSNPGTGVMGRMLDVLKLKGLQTSANNAGGGQEMLAGDQLYNNPGKKFT